MDDPSADPKVVVYRVSQLEQGLRDERAERERGDEKNADEMGKVRVALYTLSGGVVLACLTILIGQIILKGSP